MSWTVVRFDAVGSTQDIAHERAARGAPAGTVIVADVQTAGRGRLGRHWTSERGAGVWFTLIERPADASGLEVLSLRTGLALASALDALAPEPAAGRVGLKWPNDLYLDGRKLVGILIEARWREGQPEWVAIGVGINLRPPASEPRAIGLREGVTVDDVLAAVLPGLRQAATRRGPLTEVELAMFADRDVAIGRRCVEPLPGVVQGIDASGALLVAVGAPDAATVTALRAGSLVLAPANDATDADDADALEEDVR